MLAGMKENDERLNQKYSDMSSDEESGRYLLIVSLYIYIYGYCIFFKNNMLSMYVSCMCKAPGNEKAWENV